MNGQFQLKLKEKKDFVVREMPILHKEDEQDEMR